MKMIDFTPLVTMGYKKVLTRLAIASFAVALAVKMAGYQELASGLALGGAVGLLDTLIMFVGIQRSLPQGEPEAALKTMKRFRWVRRIKAGALVGGDVIVMLKLKYHVFGVCMGFLLIHIFLIFNLIFIAYQLNKKQGVKKGV